MKANWSANELFFSTKSKVHAFLWSGRPLSSFSSETRFLLTVLHGTYGKMLVVLSTLISINDALWEMYVSVMWKQILCVNLKNKRAISLHAWTYYARSLKKSRCIFFLDKVYFWPSNSCLGLVLSIELQNRVSLTIELSKPFTFGHPWWFWV